MADEIDETGLHRRLESDHDPDPQNSERHDPAPVEKRDGRDECDARERKLALARQQ
jgi:hypothetical protein